MSIENWLYVASILVSIVSIFISNYLGQKAALRKFKRDQKLLRYNSLYIPLMQLLYRQKPDKYAFYNLLIFNQFEPFENLLTKNVQYMGEESAKMFYKIINDGKSSVIKQNERNIRLLAQGKSLEPMDNNVSEAVDLYISLLIQLLSESKILSKELHLEPISEPLKAALQQEKSRATK